MNSTLDNTVVLDPLLKFIFKNWDVTQFIILFIKKYLQLLSISILSSFLFITCFVILIFLSFQLYVRFDKFSFISSLVFTSH